MNEITLKELEAMTIGELMNNTGGCYQAIINLLNKHYAPKVEFDTVSAFYSK